VLMYHHLASEGDDVATVTSHSFETHMCALMEAGYNAVSFDEVIAYVDGVGKLPDKPVCIVFDDGYESNYTIAYPILKRYGIKATVSLIVSSMGAGRNGDVPDMIPHLTWQQAREMQNSGLVSFASHTYSMHMAANGREYCARSPYESSEHFLAALRHDSELAMSKMTRELGKTPIVFAYPHGVWDAYSENALRSMGFRVTLISDAGVNTIICGEPNSLYLLRRYNITENTDINKFLAALE